MYGKAPAGVVLAAAYLLTVTAACTFPPNHLTTSLNSSLQNGELGSSIDSIYIHTGTFTNCSGCVTSISVCYLVVMFPFGSSLLSVLIINEENTTIHVHNTTGLPENQDGYCELHSLYFGTCCLEQTLAPSEQFVVQSSHHFGVWSNNVLYFHRTITIPGYRTPPPIEVGRNLNTDGSAWSGSGDYSDEIPLPYIYFNITPGNCTTADPSQALTVQTTINSGGTTYTTSPVRISSYLTTPSTTGSSSVAIESSSKPPTPISTTYPGTADVKSTVGVIGPLQSSVLPTYSEITTPSLSLVAGSSGGIVVLLLVAAITTLVIMARLRANTKKKNTAIHVCLPQRVKSTDSIIMPPLKVPMPIDINTNPAYACSSLNSTANEIYSYIPNQLDQTSSWMSTTHISTTSNEAYTTTQEKSPDTSHNGVHGESDYVVNALVYGSAQEEPLISNEPCADTDCVVNQLIYDTADGEDQLTINEAYTCANQAVSKPLPIAETNALSSLSDVLKQW